MIAHETESIEELAEKNPKVDLGLVDLARQYIKTIRNSGIAPQGYRLAVRRTPVLEKAEIVRSEKKRKFSR